MTEIDRTRVRGSFNRQARAYDEYAVVQKRVVSRLLGLIREERLNPAAILDIGSGTGLLLRRIGQSYPGALRFGIDLALGMCMTAREQDGGTNRSSLLVADTEQLPFRSDSVELAVSTSTFQWLEHLEPAFSDTFRTLRQEGMFVFAMFGEGTLDELLSSYRLALSEVGRANEDRSHRFFSVDQVARALNNAGFDDCCVWREVETEWHPDVATLLRSLKKIGAGNAAPKASRGLADRQVMLDMMEIYRRNHGCAEGIPATYQVIYGVARKAGGTG